MKKLLRALVAMVCCTVLIGIALLQGHDGVLLSGGLAIIAGLGGFVLAKGSE